MRAGVRVGGAGTRDVRPLWVLHGGPQIDPVRRLLNTNLDAPYIAVSTTCVDRATPADLGPMMRLINQADALITEPLPAGYRGLPVGLDDLIDRLRPGVPVVTIPRIAYAGLHPFHVGRDPLAGLPDPPLVPYHDLRTAAVASGHMTTEQAWESYPSAQFIREFAAWQLLRMRRTEATADIGVAGLVRGAGMEAVHTVDRPGNVLLVEIAEGIQACLDAESTAIDPGLPLLGQCTGPVEAPVAGALGLGLPAVDTWSMNGHKVARTDIHVAHLRWYAKHPEVLKAVTAAESNRMGLLGLL